MKMRRTIYPIALIIAISLVLLVFILLNQGHFAEMDHISFTSEIIEEGDRIPLEYHFKWSGFGKPKIQSITFGHQAPIELKAFIKGNGIDTEGEWGLVQASLYKQNDQTKLVKPDMSLLLKLDTPHAEAVREIPPIIIRYKTFGIIREQLVE